MAFLSKLPTSEKFPQGFWKAVGGLAVFWVDLRATKESQNNYRENDQMYGASTEQPSPQRHPRLR